MTRAIWVVSFLLCGEIQSKYPDLHPHDGYFDQGTRTNPYIISGDSTKDTVEVQPKYPTDLGTPGSLTNPYETEGEDN